MTITDFEQIPHHSNMWVIYKGRKQYVIAANFPEHLFGLVDDKEDSPADEWRWVRCENVELIRGELVYFPSTPSFALKNQNQTAQP